MVDFFDLSNLSPARHFQPSEAFVSKLPNGKITDHSDFYRYAGDDEGRCACWQQVADAGSILADDFMDAVASDRIRHRVQPLVGNA